MVSGDGKDVERAGQLGGLETDSSCFKRMLAGGQLYRGTEGGQNMVW